MLQCAISKNCSDLRVFIALSTAGLPYKEGFDGFVDLSKEMMRGRNSLQQQQTVAGALIDLCIPHIAESPNTVE